MKQHSWYIDGPFSLITGVLLVLGLFLLSSASVALSAKNFGNIYYYSMRQILYIGIGTCAFLFLQYIPIRFLKKMAIPLGILVIILLGLVFVPGIGLMYKGAHRWIDAGFFSFQPSEIAKPVFMIVLAWWFDRIKKNVETFSQGFLPVFVFVAVLGALILAETDLGTFLVIAGSSIIMFVVAGGRWRYVFLFFLIGIVSFGVLAAVKPYVHKRIDAFMHPENDPQGVGFQPQQAAIAIGSGGFWGLGYGTSQQKGNYLPEPIGDSIFAIIAEEFGIAGVLTILTLFILFLWRGMIIAEKSDDLFAKLLATGIIVTIVSQAFINMGAISGLLPLTGIPLPFISYGGTSLVMTFVSLGIIYKIARKT